MVTRIRLLLVSLLVLALTVAPQAQTLTAQIQAFWNTLRTGGYAFNTLHLVAGAYANWGTTLGTGGYGIRDNAGVMQAKNSGGAWVAIAPSGGAAPDDATYITQTPNATLTNEQALSALATGVLLSTTTTGVVSSLGVGTVAQALIGGATPAFGNTITVAGLALTSTDGWVLTNPTAATGGTTVQYSPRLKLVGAAWNSVGGASETDSWLIENRPATVAGTTTEQIYFASSIAGGAFADQFSFASNGLFSATSATLNTVLASSQVNIGAGAAFRSNGNGTNITMPANGQINLNNNGVSAGFGFDVTTDAVAQFRVRAQNAYATADALAYRASGTAITSGTTHLSAGSGMAVANVGANSCGTTTATIAGNNNAFVVTVGATAGTQCRVAFTVTAGTGWICAANDDTTTVAVRTTPVDTTHLDLIGTFTAGDNISGVCFPR